MDEWSATQVLERELRRRELGDDVSSLQCAADLERARSHSAALAEALVQRMLRLPNCFGAHLSRDLEPRAHNERRECLAERNGGLLSRSPSPRRAEAPARVSC